MAAVTCRRCCNGDSSAINTERRLGKWERNLRGRKSKRNLGIMAGQRNSVDSEIAGLRTSGLVSRERARRERGQRKGSAQEKMNYYFLALDIPKFMDCLHPTKEKPDRVPSNG